MDKLGFRMKQTRTRKGWSLEKMAKECGSSKSYIWELENNPKLKPSFRKVCAIADALSVSITNLRGQEDLFLEGYLKGLEDAIRAVQKKLPGKRRRWNEQQYHHVAARERDR